jgi:hypothetical protein
MEKYISEDSIYKYIYKLPSSSILEFDFSFKKGENYETILETNFEQEKIPKILLEDINILMEELIYQEKKNKPAINKLEKEALNSKFFLSNILNYWLSLKIFKTHIECKENLYINKIKNFTKKFNKKI